jgi:hypothetical protein
MSKSRRFLLGYIGIPVLVAMWIAILRGYPTDSVVYSGGLFLLGVYLFSTLR